MYTNISIAKFSVNYMFYKMTNRPEYRRSTLENIFWHFGDAVVTKVIACIIRFKI